MNVRSAGGLIQMTVSMTLMTAIIATSSFIALAQVPFTGELLVSGNGVTINGEAGTNGRTIVVPSTITTTGSSFATLNFGAIGKIQVAPGTTFTIDGSGNTLRGSLSAGSVTIVNGANPVTITMTCGKSVTGKTGDVVSFDATCGTPASPSGPSSAGAGVPKYLYLLIAGAAVGIIAGVSAGGGGNSTTSPTT